MACHPTHPPSTSAWVYTRLANSRPDATDRTPTHVGDDTDSVAAISLFESTLRTLDGWADELIAQTTAEKLNDAYNEHATATQSRTTKKGQRTRLQNAITTAEALMGLTLFCPGSSEVRTQLLFDIFDVDGNGTLDKDELHDMLRTVGLRGVHMIENLFDPYLDDSDTGMSVKFGRPEVWLSR